MDSIKVGLTVLVVTIIFTLTLIAQTKRINELEVQMERTNNQCLETAHRVDSLDQRGN